MVYLPCFPISCIAFVFYRNCIKHILEQQRSLLQENVIPRNAILLAWKGGSRIPKHLTCLCLKSLGIRRFTSDMNILDIEDSLGRIFAVRDSKWDLFRDWEAVHAIILLHVCLLITFQPNWSLLSFLIFYIFSTRKRLIIIFVVWHFDCH